MKLADQSVLMFTRVMAMGGTEKVILQLCRTLLPKVKKVVVCAAPGANVAELEKIGVAFYAIPDMDNKSPKTVLRILNTVSEIIRRENITVVHTHHRMAALYMRVLRGVCRVTTVNTSHNTFTDKRALTRFSLSGSNLIACGQMVKQNLVDAYGIDQDCVTVIHNAVEPFVGQLCPDAELQQLRQEGFMLVGNVGRLSEQKGMEFFLRSMEKVKAAGVRVKYIIVGDGYKRNELEALTDELGLRNDVLFLGYRNDVCNVIAQMDLIVLSSLWEGLPLTPIEAFSMGKTVVATGVDGTVEVVNHEENGLLIPPRDPDAIAEGVIRLLTDEPLRRKCEENAKKTFWKEFSFDTYSERVLAFYTAL